MKPELLREVVALVVADPYFSLTDAAVGVLTTCGMACWDEGNQTGYRNCFAAAATLAKKERGYGR
jgi:hypothetical protein